MTFNDKVEQFMKENNIKDLKSLALQADIPYTTLRDFYNKKSADNSRLSTIRKLSEFMNCSLDYLAFENNLEFDNTTPIDTNENKIKIPVLGRIPAGVPFEAIEDQYTVDYETIPKDWIKSGNKYFALILDGDSMEPEYHDKDTVIFKQTNNCESGDDCCIRINGHDATFKRVKKQENGIMIVPLNENNSTGFNSTFYTNEDIEKMPIEILGVVKRVVRNK